nr:MAG TPA: hypothetical protein [Caudoviricetes sp.]
MLRNVKFATTTANQDILAIPAVKASICERMGWKNLSVAERDARYVNLLLSGMKISFTLLFSADNTVSVNGGIPNALIEAVAYDSGSYIPVTKSIVIGTPDANIVFSYDIQ